MMNRQTILCVMAGVLLLGTAWAAEKEAKPAKKINTVVGVLTAKGPNYIEVRADGEEKARRYTPRWVGGLPKEGGGFDKEIVQTFRKLKIGSRLRLEWFFQERPRVVKIEVLKSPEKKEK